MLFIQATEASVCFIRQKPYEGRCYTVCNLASQKSSRGRYSTNYSFEEIEEIVEIDGSTEVIHEVANPIRIELPLLESVEGILVLSGLLAQILIVDLHQIVLGVLFFIALFPSNKFCSYFLYNLFQSTMEGYCNSINWEFVLDPDVLILFFTKAIRLFSYGALAVPLMLYLRQIDITEHQIGLLLTLIMVGDLFITMFLTSFADRMGRKKTLAIGSLLKLLTGVVFSTTNNFLLLTVSGIIGVISMSGSEIGPFLSIQQAALSDITENYYGHNCNAKITEVFSVYNLVGYSFQALGALVAGVVISFLQSIDVSVVESHRVVMYSYAFFGLLKFILYNQLSQSIELPPQQNQGGGELICNYGIKRKQTLRLLIILGVLFALDAFAGGFIVNSYISYWFSKEWEVKENLIGTILMICGLVGAIGGVLSSGLVKRYGAMATMLITHIPASVTIIMIPMMPNKTLTIIVMVLRFSMGNMNISARQTYVTTLVNSDQRSGAGGISNISRSLGLCFSPIVLGIFMAKQPHTISFSMPFYLSGTIKLLYDLFIWIFYVYVEKDRKNKDPQKQ